MKTLMRHLETVVLSRFPINQISFFFFFFSFEIIRTDIFIKSLLNFNMCHINIVQSQYEKLIEDLKKRVAQKKESTITKIA